MSPRSTGGPKTKALVRPAPSASLAKQSDEDVGQMVASADVMLSIIQSGVRSAAKLAVGQIPVVGPLLASTLEAAIAARSAMNLVRLQRHMESVFEHTREQFDYLRAHLDDLDVQVQGRLMGDDGSAASRIEWNYAEQAVREPIDERARMLEHAAAAIIDVRLTVAEHATVQRILQELNPEDVLELHLLDRVAGNIYEGEQYRSPEHLRHYIWGKCLGRDVLVSSGCIRLTYEDGGMGVGIHPGAAVTPVGKRMLRVVRSFVATRGTNDVPGRPVIPGSRTYQEARTVVGEQLWSAMLRLSPFLYDYPKCGKTPKDLPAPTAKAVLRATLLPTADAERLAGLRVNHVVASTMPGLPVDGLATEMRPLGEDRAEFVLHGPHDLLRWLADDVEAAWG
jgi:hypothetical protein